MSLNKIRTSITVLSLLFSSPISSQTVCDAHGNCRTDSPSEAPQTISPPTINPPSTVRPLSCQSFGPWFAPPAVPNNCQISLQPYPYNGFVYQSFWANCCS